jgi:hypothetical protein
MAVLSVLLPGSSNSELFVVASQLQSKLNGSELVQLPPEGSGNGTVNYTYVPMILPSNIPLRTSACYFAG